MSPSFRPTDIKVGDKLVVIGVQGEDFGDDETCWGEHGFIPNAVVTVREIIKPDPEAHLDYYGFTCEGRCTWTDADGTDIQTVSETEVVPYVELNTIKDVEAFLNTR